MHDPLTVAWNLKIPLFFKRQNTLYKDKRSEWQFYSVGTIWHKDPERGGSDDSCGWFKRGHHGDSEVLEKIVKRFEFDWDRVFQPAKKDHDPEDGLYTGKTYFCGLFKPSGDPHFSASAITLNLFFIATGEYFKSDGLTNWKKSRVFMQKNLFDILMFAENPTDSLFDGITRKFEKGCGEEYGDRARTERIRRMASCIYGWILRREQKWWQHPRWHIHHWRLQIHILQQLNRFLFARCHKCGRGFKWGESVIGSWSGNAIWHDRCDESNKPSPCLT